MRFVLLLHEGCGTAHYDLFLEMPGREKLMAWHVSQWGGDDKKLAAERIGDHRKAYMKYEGEISGGRGTVKRVAEGMAKVLEMSEKEMRVRLEGGGVEVVLPLWEGEWKMGLVDKGQDGDADRG